MCQIRQEEGWYLDAWINLAHTYFEERHYGAALNLVSVHAHQRTHVDAATLGTV